MKRKIYPALGFFAAALMMVARAEDQTYTYTVQITAVVQTNPAQILLSWPQDPYGVDTYTVYRKLKTDTEWGPGATLSGLTTSYLDTSVSVGSAYEYQIFKAAALGYRGYGYIYAGINAPLIENRGKLILVVATNSTIGLGSELSRLQSDLIGDGWAVLRHDVSSNDTPDSVKSLIVADYNADPGNVSALFLFGHVPVFHCGDLNYDGHESRPMPSDSYYGDIDGFWTTNTDFLPTDVELMIGRVDLFAMPGQDSLVPWPSETEMLRNYLNKDHAYRQKLVTVPHRAFMGNLRGDEGGEAAAASGYRNFAPLIGTNLTEANVDGGPTNRWISLLSTNNYLWAYGCGAGLANGISGLGTNDDDDGWWMLSPDVVGLGARSTFVMLFGSWFGNWDDTDDVMRCFIAVPDYGLTACMAGRPHWYLHHMALGETIGYSTRLSMNNDGSLYQNHSNILNRAIYVSLMGDPSLRQDVVAPVTNLGASPGAAGSVTLSWTASDDVVAGYHVYRATSSSGPFTRLTGNLVAGTSFTDNGVAPNTYTYMVRAVALLTTPSGTYFCPSQGAFATANVVSGLIVQAQYTNNAMVLTWNSQNGTGYHVQYKDGLLGNWSNLSGNITAAGVQSSWTDPNVNQHSMRLYRITSP